MVPFASVIRKKIYFTLFVVCLIVFDTIIVGCLFAGVWVLEQLAILLGIHSWGFFCTDQSDLRDRIDHSVHNLRAHVDRPVDSIFKRRDYIDHEGGMRSVNGE